MFCVCSVAGCSPSSSSSSSEGKSSKSSSAKRSVEMVTLTYEMTKRCKGPYFILTFDFFFLVVVGYINMILLRRGHTLIMNFLLLFGLNGFVFIIIKSISIIDEELRVVDEQRSTRQQSEFLSRGLLLGLFDFLFLFLLLEPSKWSCQNHTCFFNFRSSFHLAKVSGVTGVNPVVGNLHLYS